MLPWTITLRQVHTIENWHQVCVYAPTPLAAMKEAHKLHPRPKYVVACVERHSDELVPCDWIRL